MRNNNILLANSFNIKNDDLLFFNIFIKNFQLIMICPINKNYTVTKNNIEIKYKDYYLTIDNIIIKNQYEPIQILFSKFPYNNQNKYEITIKYNNLIKVFQLSHIITNKKKKLTLTTLFKDDYNIINIFYDYYKNQGVEHFYMYYNGYITDEIKELYNKKDITLVEWPFKYWNDNSKYSKHYSQLGQIHDAIYLHGKGNSEYMIFCDLDEYMFNKKYKLHDLLVSNNYNSYIFRNLWCKTINNKIPSEFPNLFMTDDYILPYPERSKCIHKLDEIKYINIHLNPIQDKNTFSEDCIFFHFYNWSTDSSKRKFIKFNENNPKVLINKNENKIVFIK